MTEEYGVVKGEPEEEAEEEEEEEENEEDDVDRWNGFVDDNVGRGS